MQRDFFVVALASRVRPWVDPQVEMKRSMTLGKALTLVSVLSVLVIVAALAWLTLSDADVCADPQQAVSGAVLADSEAEQEGLINRALLVLGQCEQPREAGGEQ